METGMTARTQAGRTYCSECDEVRRYARDAAGLWVCTTCGGPIECVECGLQLHSGHQCTGWTPDERMETT